MRKQITRAVLVAAGAITVLVILLSHSLVIPGQGSDTSKLKKTEQAATIATAPSDVVTSSAVQLDEVALPFVESILQVAASQPVFVFEGHVLTPYRRVLFRQIISPNAP